MLFGNDQEKETDEFWTSIIKEFDKNHDGVIDFDEFKSAMITWGNKEISPKLKF